VKTARAHLRIEVLELARYPAFTVPTLLFPTMFFLFFVVPHPGRDANARMAAFAGFAVLGIAFFQFGVGIAAERASPWQLYLRTLPAGPVARFAARSLSALCFSLAAAAGVIVAAVVATPVSLPAIRWFSLGAALLGGSVPFALLGVAIGYWLSPKAALPVANLLYLALAYLGGLWTGPRGVPAPVREFAESLPTSVWRVCLGDAVHGRWSLHPWVLLGGWAVAFGALAARGYVRDEGQRFR
jgi:ABC-2 type transport system permease protein